MALTKKMKIVIIIAIILGASIPLTIWGVLKLTETHASIWKITLYVNPIKQVNVTYEQITNPGEFTSFTQHFMTIKTGGFLDRNVTCKGIRVWDLIVHSGIDYGAANAIRFVDPTGYSSPAIPISIIQGAGNLAAITYEGQIDMVNDGPLLPMINQSVVNPLISSVYMIKNCTRIIFEQYNNWNLTIFGNLNGPNATFSLGQVIWANRPSSRFTNRIFNYTDVGGTSINRTFNGISVYDLYYRNTIFGSTPPATNIRFIAKDGTRSNTIPFATVKGSSTLGKIAIVWAENGVLLNDTNGYLMAVVDFSITKPTNSSYYWTENVVAIEFI